MLHPSYERSILTNSRCVNPPDLSSLAENVFSGLNAAFMFTGIDRV